MKVQRYCLTIIHAEEDNVIPWWHTPILFWHAVNASVSAGISYEELEVMKENSKRDLGPARTELRRRMFELINSNLRSSN
jgi:abhydrolase domain-containing protein 12